MIRDSPIAGTEVSCGPVAGTASSGTVTAVTLDPIPSAQRSSKQWIGDDDPADIQFTGVRRGGCKTGLGVIAFGAPILTSAGRVVGMEMGAVRRGQVLLITRTRAEASSSRPVPRRSTSATVAGGIAGSGARIAPDQPSCPTPGPATSRTRHRMV